MFAHDESRRELAEQDERGVEALVPIRGVDEAQVGVGDLGWAAAEPGQGVGRDQPDTVLAVQDGRGGGDSRKLAGRTSTKVTRAAPRLSASKPTEPAPA